MYAGKSAIVIERFLNATEDKSVKTVVYEWDHRFKDERNAILSGFGSPETPPYTCSPDLAVTNCAFFPRVKSALRVQRLSDLTELKYATKTQ